MLNLSVVAVELVGLFGVGTVFLGEKILYTKIFN